MGAMLLQPCDQNLRAACRFGRSSSVVHSKGEWRRVMDMSRGRASTGISPTSLVIGGNYRGWLDLGDGITSPSFDTQNNGWDAFAVAYNR
jgi:hypothetical protein